MAPWIVILTLWSVSSGYAGGRAVAVSTVVFGDESSCRAAAQAWQASVRASENVANSAVCVRSHGATP